MKPRIVIGYSRPDNPAWEINIIPHANEIHAVVINPGNGPGAEGDPNYSALCKRLRSVGIKVFGYLYSGTNLDLRAQGHPNVYGSRPQAELQREIDQWSQWYGDPMMPGGLLEGFFVDETANELSKFEYYKELSNRIQPSQGIFWNFGRPPLLGLIALRGSMCISERAQGDILLETYPAYVREISSQKWLVIASNVKVEDAPRVAAKIKSSNVLFYCLSTAKGEEPDYGVETEIFLGPAIAPTPAPEDPNWSSLELQQGLRAIGASPDATSKDLVPLITAMKLENTNLKAGVKGFTNAQIIADVARRLALIT